MRFARRLRRACRLRLGTRGSRRDSAIRLADTFIARALPSASCAPARCVSAFVRRRAPHRQVTTGPALDAIAWLYMECCDHPAPAAAITRTWRRQRHPRVEESAGWRLGGRGHGGNPNFSSARRSGADVGGKSGVAPKRHDEMGVAKKPWPCLITMKKRQARSSRRRRAIKRLAALKHGEAYGEACKTNGGGAGKLRGACRPQRSSCHGAAAAPRQLRPAPHGAAACPAPPQFPHRAHRLQSHGRAHRRAPSDAHAGTRRGPHSRSPAEPRPRGHG